MPCSICFESRIKISLSASFPVDFLQCLPLSEYRKNPQKCTFYWRLSEQFSGSQAAFETIVRAIGGYQKAGTSSLKRVFIENSKNLNLTLFTTRHHKNLKTTGAHSVSNELILKNLKHYSKIFITLIATYIK
jgi:hypothetical protein